MSGRGRCRWRAKRKPQRIRQLHEPSRTHGARAAQQQAGYPSSSARNNKQQQRLERGEAAMITMDDDDGQPLMRWRTASSASLASFPP